MQASSSKTDLIQALEKQILSLQGFKKPIENQCINTGLPDLEAAFPFQTFPTGAVHEFISQTAGDSAATNGFIAGLLSHLMQGRNACIWISTKRLLFPPALTLFGIEPERIVFIDIAKPKDVLWAIEEALKCDVLCAVVGELSELSFSQSRRLQLAVEDSHVTGFIHRINPRTENTVACITRWKVRQLASETTDNLPGLSYPRWQVDLKKVRNGRPGNWQIEWSGDGFRQIHRQPAWSIADHRLVKTA